MSFRIRNWDRYQHYKNRNPPWIKLHFELLSSEDWVTLDDASRVLATACMLIASRHDGAVPDDPAYIHRVAYLNGMPDFKPLVNTGFLIPDNIECASKYASKYARPETETETERETEEKSARARVNNYTREFQEFWQKYPKKVGKKDAYRAWRKAKDRPTIDVVLHAIDVQRGTKQWRQGYIPNPATWLNQGRWDDEIETKPDYYGPGVDPRNVR